MCYKILWLLLYADLTNNYNIKKICNTHKMDKKVFERVQWSIHIE